MDRTNLVWQRDLVEFKRQVERLKN
jgi:hypothetical protein